MKASEVSAASLLALLLLLSGRAKATPSVAMIVGDGGPDAALDHFLTVWMTSEPVGSQGAPPLMPGTARLFSGAADLTGVDAVLPPTPSSLGTVADAVPRVVALSRADDVASPSVFVGTGGGFSVIDSLINNPEAASQTFTYNYVPATRRTVDPPDAAPPRGATAPVRSAGIEPDPAVHVMTPSGSGATASRQSAGNSAQGDAGAPLTDVNISDPNSQAAQAMVSTVFVNSAGAPGEGRRNSLTGDLALRNAVSGAVSRQWPVDTFPLDDGQNRADGPLPAGISGVSEVKVPLVFVASDEVSFDATLSVFPDLPTGPGVNNRISKAIDSLESLSGPEIASLGVLGTALVGMAELWRRRRRPDSET